jgi:hypothetical protein
VRRKHALAISALVAVIACKSQRQDPPLAITPPPKPTATDPTVQNALVGAASWTAGPGTCPIAMTSLPPTKGKNIGDLALAQGHRPGQINLDTVKSLAEAPPSFGSQRGDSVDVLYVQTHVVEPTLDTSDTFHAGESEGTAYVWDAATKRFACIAHVSATSSSSVTALDHTEPSAKLWLAIDLEIAIERAIVANARPIAGIAGVTTPTDAGLRDAIAMDAARAPVR